MNRFGRISRTIVALVMLSVAATHAVAQANRIAPVLDQVSERAQIVVVAPNLSRLSEKLALLNESLELGVPELADVLGEFKRDAGVERGLADNGALVLVVEDATTALMGGQAKVYLLVPVSDYDAFIGSFDATVDGPVAQLNSATGDPNFIRKVGNYALVGETSAAVQSYQPANNGAKWIRKAGDLGGNALAGGDVAMVIDIESMSMTLAGMTTMLQFMAEMGIANAPPEQQASARAGVQWLIQGFQAFVRDGSALVVASDLTEQGIGGSIAVQFKENSALAKRFANGGKAADHLARLPDKPYLVAMSANTDAFNIAGIAESILPLIASTDVPAADAFKAMLPIVQQMRGMSLVVAPPTDETQEPSVLTYMNVTDAAAYRDAFKKYLAQIDGKPATAADPTTVATRYTANQLKVGDVAADQYEIRTDALTAQTGYLVGKDEHILHTNVADAQVLRDGLAAMTRTNGLGANGDIAQTRKSLLPDSAFELFINFDAVMALAAAMEGGPVDNTGKAGLIGVSISIGEGGAVLRQWTPMPAAKIIKEKASEISLDNPL